MQSVWVGDPTSATEPNPAQMGPLTRFEALIILHTGYPPDQTPVDENKRALVGLIVLV